MKFELLAEIVIPTLDSQIQMHPMFILSFHISMPDCHYFPFDLNAMKERFIPLIEFSINYETRYSSNFYSYIVLTFFKIYHWTC